MIEHAFTDVMPTKTQKKAPYKKKPSENAITRFATAFGTNARQLGKGSYGIVYSVDPTPHAQQVLMELSSRLHNKMGDFHGAPSNAPLVFKVVRPEDGTWASFIKDSTRETAAHIAAHAVAPDLVPKLYVGGTTSAGLYVTVMEQVVGQPLAKTKMTPALYEKLHNGILRFMQAGIVHADLHDDNVIVTPDGHVKFIDFGFAVMLPPDVRAKMSRVLPNVDAAWDIARPYVDALQLQRIHGLSWYNPNVKALRVWRHRISKDEHSASKTSPTSVLAAMGSSGTTSSGKKRTRSASRSLRSMTSRSLRSMTSRSSKRTRFTKSPESSTRRGWMRTSSGRLVR